MAALDSRVLDLLTDALAKPAINGFEVHYQPIVRISDQAIVAVEALARWRHPIAGNIDPGVFVPAAERAGMMATLDDFVLERVCRDANVLMDLLGPPANMHVNIAASRLGLPSLERSIARATGKLQLDPHRLVLEITETSRIDDLAAAAGAIRRIRECGVRFALDDFGSGFNMLVHFHALPVDCIKLDAALTYVGSDPARTEALCQSVLAICEHFGTTVVAEGIETAEQAAMLAKLGCPLGQGHLYGRAQPLVALSAVR
jgi:diguanylate cyclase